MRSVELVLIDVLAPALRETKTEKALVFYVPKLNTPICDTEIQTLQERREEFLDQKCEIIISSADTEEAFRKYWKTHRLTLQHSADENGVRAKALGAWDYNNNTPQRCVVLLENGKAGGFNYNPVLFQLYPLNVGRSVAELLRVIDGYNSGKLCPEASKCKKKDGKEKG